MRYFLLSLLACVSINGFRNEARISRRKDSPRKGFEPTHYSFLHATSSRLGVSLQLSSDVSQEQPQEKSKAECTARLVAARALMQTNKKDFSIRRLENDKHFHQMDQRDRSFARNLVSTVERRKGQLDKVLALCMKQPIRTTKHKQDALVHAALRIGAAQLLILDTPAHAALKETVDVLRMDPQINVSEPKIKFVNAILRRIQREQDDGNVLDWSTCPSDNIAPWLLKEWKTCWGEEKLAAIANAAMVESPVCISVNQELGASEEEKLEKLQSIEYTFLQCAEEREDASAEILSHGSIEIDKTAFPGAISKWPLYKEGDWWVQDASATLPAIALSNALLKDNDNPQQDAIVDLCAAPGGKTAQLLSLGFPSVTAVEVSSRRCKQLESNMSRLRLEDRCTVVVADGRKWIPPEGPESVAGVLLDVPCSATGTASRRPDVLRRDRKLDSLLETQYDLAKHCIDNILKPGGVMVYATCSLLKRESEDQVQKILKREDGANAKLLPFVPGEIPGFDEAIDENGCLRVIPGWLPGKLSTCDGFFVARLQKL